MWGIVARGLTVLVLALLGWPAEAQTRVALVIGNSAYQHVPVLANPLNDSNDIAAALARLDFSVDRVTDGRYDDMRRALRDFAAKAEQAEIAVVYFAGHGIEIAGDNWLIPVDAALKVDVAANHEAISLRGIMPIVLQASKLGLVILDACRNDPFATRLRISTRAVHRGLARIEPTGNVLVAYAAKDGTTAVDGAGRNSPFTGALLNHIETPGLEINFLFRRVRDDVIAATARRQEPFVYGSLSTEAIFLKAAALPDNPVAAKPPAMPQPQPSTSEAERSWAAIKDTTSAATLNAFIKRYGDSFYAVIARERLEQLKKPEQTKVTTRTTSPSNARPTRPAAPGGWTCSRLYARCRVICVENTGNPACVERRCPAMRSTCMQTGCWHGRRFNSCGVPKI